MPTPHEETLLLASCSPRRAALLRAAGIRFAAMAPRTRERSRASRGAGGPQRMAMANAADKAAAGARARPGHWALGADTIVVLGRRIFGKPRHAAEAARMLSQLQGRTHRVITAVCLARKGSRARRFAVTSRVTFRPMNAAAIARYLRRVSTRDKAGAYAAQERPRQIIRRIEGSRSNVIGLPMERLRPVLRALGFLVRRSARNRAGVLGK